jgi:hypothetical protein
MVSELKRSAERVELFLKIFLKIVLKIPSVMISHKLL